MAGEDAAGTGSQGDSLIPPRERPWLLPYNRKLRHLQGITLRNLILTPSSNRSRGKTIDDEAIPSTLKSPTKALAMREAKRLGHSRSSSDLRAASADTEGTNGDMGAPSSPTKSKRPTMAKTLRRRSTMEWSGASPLERQKKLQDITGGHTADTFFSLHVDNLEEPIYISETIERAMNPNFRFFDLGSCGPGVTRLDKLTVKVWAKNEDLKKWQYLVEFTVQLRALQFIGKALGNFKHPLPQNCILFHMTDGIYTSFTDLPVGESIPREPLAAPKEHPDGLKLKSSSYDALMRLSTLDDCIQDALATRDRLAEEIKQILEKNKQGLLAVQTVPEAEETSKMMEGAVNTEKRRVEALKRKRDELKANIQYRKDMMQKGRELQERVAEEMEAQGRAHSETKELAQKTEEEIRGQRRRICEDLQKVFPIEPVPGKSLIFTIRGLTLPNGEFDDANEAAVAAALGYVAQVVSVLSPYLSVLLPYPVTVNGSTSTIEDPLAMNTKGPNNLRTYPLFMKGVVRYRFDYGVFLLNKNIEILSNELGLRPIEGRHTLPNLKYLLFVATAGKGELPARKSGGIRAFLRQDGSLSRTESMDSTATASSVGDLGTKSKEANGKPLTAVQSLQKQKGAMWHGSRLREVE